MINEYAMAVSAINILARDCDERAKSVLSQAIERLHGFAMVHRALQPPIGEHLDLCGYLQPLCLALTQTILEDRGVFLNLGASSVTLEARRAWRVGLILSELITNAARHGKWPPGGGAIEVDVVLGVREIQLRVSDNGAVTHRPIPGRGTYILEALAYQLGGRLHREFGDTGTIILLTFPRDASLEPPHGGRNSELLASFQGRVTYSFKAGVAIIHLPD